MTIQLLRRLIQNNLTYGNDRYNVIIEDISYIFNAVMDKMSEEYNRAESVEKYINVQAAAAEVQFIELDNGIQFVFPRNLPRKKNFKDKYDIDMFRDSYLQTFKRYFNTHPMRFEEKVLIHIHSIYLKETEMLDYDNMAIKQILDIIALFLLVDDNPTRYNLYMSASVGSKRETRISVEIA